MTLLHPLSQSNATCTSNSAASERIFRPWDDQDFAQNTAKPLSPPLKATIKTESTETEDDSSSSAPSSPVSKTVSRKSSRSPHRSLAKSPKKCSSISNQFNGSTHPTTSPNSALASPASLNMIPPSFLANAPAEWIASLEALPRETLQHLVALNASSSSDLNQWYYQWMQNPHQHPQFHPLPHPHPIPVLGTAAVPTRKQRPKKFRCPHCNVGFSNNGQLRGHVRSHTGERPFQCEDPSCGKTFTRNEELTRHKRIHSGLRPFPCSVCGKRFGRRDHLKKHTRTHQKPPPMPNPTCLLPSLPPSLSFSHASFMTPTQHPMYLPNGPSAASAYPCYGL